MLSLITFLPAVAALVLALFLRGNDAAAGRNAKWVALVATLATLAISLYVLAKFDPSNTGMQFVAERVMIVGLNYKRGVDGVSAVWGVGEGCGRAGRRLGRVRGNSATE